MNNLDLRGNDPILEIVRAQQIGKVRSKQKVTVLKTIADRYGIRPGADIVWPTGGRSNPRDSARKGQETGRSEIPAPSVRPAYRALARLELGAALGG